MNNRPKSWEQFKECRLDCFENKKSMIKRFNKILPVLKAFYNI